MTDRPLMLLSRLRFLRWTTTVGIAGNRIRRTHARTQKQTLEKRKTWWWSPASRVIELASQLQQTPSLGQLQQQHSVSRKSRRRLILDLPEQTYCHRETDSQLTVEGCESMFTDGFPGSDRTNSPRVSSVIMSLGSTYSWAQLVNDLWLLGGR